MPSVQISDLVQNWFNVRTFGANGNSNGDDTPAIQSALQACSNAGGGLVIVPDGNYALGSNVLFTNLSNVTLWIQNGVSITGSGTFPTSGGTECMLLDFRSGAFSVNGATLLVNPMTTQGDTLYGGALGAPARLAKGAEGAIYQEGTSGNAPEWWDVRASQLANEFYWPPYAPVGTNLHDALLWWAKIAGATVTYSTATTEGVATTYGEDLVKVVAASASDGASTTWTYANEKRVKSGRVLSAMVAVYVVTAARTATLSLVNSDATTVSTTVSTVGSWVLVPLQALTLAGTSVAFRVTLDGAGTVLVVPLGALIGSKALALPPRGSRLVDGVNATVVNAVDPGGAGFTAVSITSVTSALAIEAQLVGFYFNNTTPGTGLAVRRKGDASTDGNPARIAFATTSGVSLYYMGRGNVALDSSQQFEYKSGAAAGDVESVIICVASYREWA